MNDEIFRILLVDDDEAINELVTDAFKFENFEVTTAGDGQEALEVWQSDPEGFHVIITDYTMPRLNGLELLSAVDQQVVDDQLRPLYYLVSGLSNTLEEGHPLYHKVIVVSKPYDIFSFVEQVSVDLRTARSVRKVS